MDMKLFPGEFGVADIGVVGGKPTIDDGLETAVVISLFSERGAWWADPELGSNLAALRREKMTADLPDKIREACEESLAWLKADGIASAVVVDVARRDKDNIDIGVRVERPNGQTSFYSYNWDAMKKG